MKKTVAIIGGGPAGLMAAEILSQHNVAVHVYDAMPSLARKFLMAGKSGLNITHSENFTQFIARYNSEKLATYLEQFKPEGVIAWANTLGVETFVGSSGRVFPKVMKASPLLRAWLERLKNNGVQFHLKHNFIGWEDESIVFEAPTGISKIKPDATILALGGASWPKLGSRGEWTGYLEKLNINIKPFRPANCGFNVAWTKYFSEKFHGQPIKSVILSFTNFKQQGEFVVTRSGIEGSLIYSASAKLRDILEQTGTAKFSLDLLPDISLEKLITLLQKNRSSRSISTHIKRTTGIEGVKMGLLNEFLPKEILQDPEKLAHAIKALPVKLLSTMSLASAISSAGGVCFSELDENLMLRKLPGVFCAGEMVDWEAPTGGYLLTACFALGKAAGLGVLRWLKN